MSFCLKCKSEYKKGEESCPVCGGALSASPPSATSDHRSEEPLVLVYDASDQFISEGVAQALEQAGLPVIVEADRSPTVFDGIDLSIVGRYSQIFTVASRAEEAKKIVADFLAAYERGDLALPEDKEDPSAPQE